MRSMLFLLSLFFPTIASANEALVLICSRNFTDCTRETARVVLTIYVEEVVPTGCLISAMQQVSQSQADLIATDEIAKIICGK